MRDLHTLLLETEVRQGRMVCGNCGHEYRIKEGIANFLLPSHLGELFPFTHVVLLYIGDLAGQNVRLFLSGHANPFRGSLLMCFSLTTYEPFRELK